MNTPEKGIITIAVGKKYINYAKYLAYSCMIHSSNTLRGVITDFPDELSPYYDFVIPFPENLNPFSIKTQLYKFTPFKKTLYIDTDSLLFSNIDFIWELTKNNSIAYNGIQKTTGTWYFDIQETMSKYELTWIPEFNSGLFLFDDSEKTKTVFDYAHNLLINNPEKDISFFRKNMLPDEPFLSIAFSKYGIEPFDDNSRFSRTLIDSKKINVNVIKGISFFYKDDKPVFPSIIHFCGRFGNIIYKIQKIKLLFFFKISISSLFYNIISGFRDFYKKPL